MDKNRDFDLVSAVIGDNSLVVCYTDWVEGTRKENNVVIETHTVKRPVAPHPDLVEIRDNFKEYLMRSQGHYDVYDEAIKYLKGEQKQKVVDKFNKLKASVKITAIEIDGKNDLKGVTIKGKVTSFNGQMKNIKAPKILFKGETIGIETNAQGDCELLEEEIKKYLFESKKGAKDIFDDDTNGSSPKVGPQKAA